MLVQLATTTSTTPTTTTPTTPLLSEQFEAVLPAIIQDLEPMEASPAGKTWLAAEQQFNTDN